MSRILRHAADSMGLALSPDGFAKLDDLLALDSMRGAGLAEIEDIVRSDAKGRFTLRNESGTYFIRANQGHSVKSVVTEELLTPVESADDFPTCIHGTTLEAWTKFIRVEGLRRMKRNEIHFATSEHAKSGVRWSSEVFIYINLALCLQNSIPFFISDNGVLLSPGLGPEGRITPEHFTKVVHAKTGARLDLEPKATPRAVE